MRGILQKLYSQGDGSLDISLPKDSPGKDKEANWPPSPEGGFSVTLRIDWPKESVLDGKRQPPPVNTMPGESDKGSRE
jgi:hypothetical protein